MDMRGKEGSMLVLSRRRDEKIVIGGDIVVTVVEVRGDKVRLGIEAPRDVPVYREEIQDKGEANATGTQAGAAGTAGDEGSGDQRGPPDAHDAPNARGDDPGPNGG